jgi:uncharacterized protein
MSRIQVIIDDRDELGNTHLMRASLDGRTETVKALLRKGADVNAQNHEGRTALMFAVVNLHTVTVKTLLRGGADVNAQAADGCTPLILAAFNGDAEIAQVLLKWGADAGKTLLPGKTALVVATQRRYKALVELLKRASGPTLNAKPTSIPSETASHKSIPTML